jgi:hypothetical protein
VDASDIAASKRWRSEDRRYNTGLEFFDGLLFPNADRTILKMPGG